MTPGEAPCASATTMTESVTAWNRPFEAATISVVERRNGWLQSQRRPSTISAHG